MSKKKSEETAVDMTTDKSAVKNTEPSFTKEQLVSSMRFRDVRYVLAGCLEDGRRYTIQEAEKRLHHFLSKEEK